MTSKEYSDLKTAYEYLVKAYIVVLDFPDSEEQYRNKIEYELASVVTRIDTWIKKIETYYKNTVI